MSPEHLGGNRWRLLEGEFVEGKVGSGEEKTIGPGVIVRVLEIKKGFLQVQGGEEKVYVEGKNFKAVVQKR